MKRILALTTLLLTLASTLPGRAQEVEMFSLTRSFDLPGIGCDELLKHAEAFHRDYQKYRPSAWTGYALGSKPVLKWSTHDEITGIQYKRKTCDISYWYSFVIECRDGGYTLTLENFRFLVFDAAIYGSDVPVFYGGLRDFNKKRIFFCDTLKEAVTLLFEDEIVPHAKEYMEYGKPPEIDWKEY